MIQGVSRRTFITSAAGIIGCFAVGGFALELAAKTGSCVHLGAKMGTTCLARASNAIAVAAHAPTAPSR